jgi:hypothetical protein
MTADIALRDLGIQVPMVRQREGLKNLCIPDRAKKPKARV